MTGRKKNLKKTKQHVGEAGEKAAASLLRKEGFRIIERNFRTPLGEIDVIAEEDDVLCFIEVKTRRSGAYGGPAEAVTPRKQRQIAKVAALYISRNCPEGRTCRFDVVTVTERNDLPVADLIRDAFRAEDRYRQRLAPSTVRADRPDDRSAEACLARALGI